MKPENQPGYIPHVGPVSPTKPIRSHHKSVKDTIKDLLVSARKHVAEFISSVVTYKADAILLTGKEKHSGESLRVFYFGHGENLAYLAEQLFREHEDAILAADVNPWRVNAWRKKHQADVDLVVLDLPWPVCRLVRNDDFIALAPWINMVIPIGETWEAVVSRWSKNAKGVDLRRIRKHQLTYRTIDSEQAFLNFYHAFYVPYVTTRFGAAAFIEPEEKIVSIHEFGEIIEILRGDTVIVAGVLIENYGSLGFVWTGMPANVDPTMSDGGFAALYYFNVRLAYERGCDQVDCFTSRPSLSDGVLRYKRKWGAILSGCDALNGQILLKPMRMTPAVTAFLQQNPLITLVDGGFVARLFFDESEVSAERVLETVDTYYTDGLRAMRLYSLNGFAHGIVDSLRERGLPVQLYNLNGIEDPLQAYCRP